MKTHQLLVFGTAALSVVLSTSRTDANESALGVSSDSTCATYPYVNIGYGEVNPFGTCSGNGECVQTNVTGSIMPEYQCVCAEGWTGRSDWINGDGYDCGVNISAVQAMYVHTHPHTRARQTTPTSKYTHQNIITDFNLTTHSMSRLITETKGGE